MSKRISYRGSIVDTTTEKINLDELIDTLHTFAIDPKYVNKIKTTVKFLLNKYPDIFLDMKGLKV